MLEQQFAEVGSELLGPEVLEQQFAEVGSEVLSSEVLEQRFAEVGEVLGPAQPVLSVRQRSLLQ